MIAILMSIKPKWCELIASGKKTLEARKTRPKIETPFKVYIYATKENPPYVQQSKTNPALYKNASGKVIGEFVCKKFVYIEAGIDTNLTKHLYNTAFLYGMCLTNGELWEYLHKSRENCGGWAWHISELKIYDEPKELSVFGLKRAPQSWQYARELKKGE